MAPKPVKRVVLDARQHRVKVAQVAKGLTFVLLGFTIKVALVLLGGFIALLSGLLAMWLPPIVALAATGLGLKGLLDCTNAPEAAHGRGPINVSAFFTGVGLVFELLQSLLEPMIALGLASSICTLASMVAFVVFLKRFAEFLGRDDLVDAASKLQVAILLLACAVPIALVVAAIAPQGGITLSLLVMLGGVWTLFLYADVLGEVKAAAEGRTESEGQSYR